MTKDTFQILADEITLIRGEVQQLRRSSLDKDEAEKLNSRVAKALGQFEKTALSVEDRLEERIDTWGRATATSAVEAAIKGAERAVESQVGKLRGAVTVTVDSLSQAAGEARREAWRWFGGFWVWIASMLATGALLGALAAFWIGGTISARDFGDYPRVFCSAAGGQRVTQDDGSSFCAIWIDRPDQGQ